MRRFFVPRDAIHEAQVSFPPDQARHIRTVLRLHAGDRVLVFDGTGAERVVELLTVTADRVRGRVIEAQQGVRLPVFLALLQGVPKAAKMDQIVRMGTELGVMEFVPFLSTRTVAAGQGRVRRWQRIAVEAAKQCRRADVPVIHAPIPLAQALEHVKDFDLVLVPWEGEDNRTMPQVLETHTQATRIAVVIGPEGGLASDEVVQATRLGALPVTLGSLVLRTETAGVVALAMVLYEMLRRGKNLSNVP